MNEERAIRIATEARRAWRVPDNLALVSAQQRIIEVVEPIRPAPEQPPGPGPVRDLIAWIVAFGSGGVAVEFSIDDATEAIVRVRRSAGAPMFSPAKEIA